MSFDLATYKQKTGGISFSLNSEISFGRKKFSDKKKEIFYRELCMLLKSGVDFKKALEILSNQTKNSLEKQIILEIKKNVIEGKSIFESMMISGNFSPYEYYSIQIGEETRKLEEVLTELQKFFNRKIQMKRQIVSVLTYPAIVMLVTVLVLYFMLSKVVPMFSSVFKQFGSELPKSTQIIIRMSNNSGTIFGILGFIILTLIVINYIFKNKDGYKKITSSLLLKVPFFGKLIKKIYISRFCQSMSLLTSSKTTLITSLSLTSKMISFYPIHNSISFIISDVTKGISLSNSLRKHKVYDYRMVSMVEVAEEVNQLEDMFEKLSNQYNDEISHETKMIGVILEPLIIIVIGLVVGVIMISMYAPMFDLSKIISH